MGMPAYARRSVPQDGSFMHQLLALRRTQVVGLVEAFDHLLEGAAVFRRRFKEILEGIDLAWLGKTRNQAVPEPEICRQGSLASPELIKEAVGIEGTVLNLGHVLLL